MSNEGLQDWKIFEELLFVNKNSKGWNPNALVVDGNSPIDFNADRISSKVHRVFSSQNVSTRAY